MRSDAPALIPVFRSDLQARVLLHVLTGARATTAADLARRLGAAQPTVAREVRRLLDAGLLRGEQVGRSVLLHAADDNPATAPLRQLLVVTYGPSHLVERALRGVPGIDEAYLHGSWAARFHGEVGPAPGDIDVLVVGRPARGDVDTALLDVEPALRREVNTTYLDRERWQRGEDPFVSQVRSRPLVRLDLDLPPTGATP